MEDLLGRERRTIYPAQLEDWRWEAVDYLVTRILQFVHSWYTERVRPIVCVWIAYNNRMNCTYERKPFIIRNTPTRSNGIHARSVCDVIEKPTCPNEKKGKSGPSSKLVNVFTRSPKGFTGEQSIASSVGQSCSDEWPSTKERIRWFVPSKRDWSIFCGQNNM